MARLRDAVVVGGGPAGLAFAAAAAARGLDVLVLERRRGPVDKACGEGVLPAGVEALERLGVRARLGPALARPLRELRWVDPSGAVARLALPGPGGLGVRRVALEAALRERAREAGAALEEGVEATDHRVLADRVRVRVAGGAAVEGRVLVAADGLGSPTRRRAGLERRVRGPERFGVRRHADVADAGDAVEVHFGDGAEAYVTPVGPRQVGVAFLFERGAARSFEALLERFPALAARLEGAAFATPARGAGPLARAARARVADRLVLLGDAAGYLDAVTGEGLSLAFGSAIDLAALLPGALSRGASARALAPYEAAWRRRWAPYARWTRLVLALARHPAVRRRVIALAGAAPWPFERAVAAAVGAGAG
ncbi:NAD(P)/FAD-dependent oxidoreductase [Anaeromyxobacter dehalogenans]|uniref:FAD-binding monooxygenase n=1 Tax=Anaeromyxobacter dehalogenans (strain 2CP-C) TaxID=290397 RepID=Q2IMY0_ANADE|nr:NAD(P)/FAD-dependent oxidoreductase [Anaeromyxobacter dehalogenans]ABC80166.1 FAD-binding monooxygenase [Anaeromyxobacter dehalogenans 2CP-C]